MRQLSDGGVAALGRQFSGAPAAAAAAEKIENSRRAERLDGRPFRTRFGDCFELDLASRFELDLAFRLELNWTSVWAPLWLIR